MDLKHISWEFLPPLIGPLESFPPPFHPSRRFTWPRHFAGEVVFYLFFLTDPAGVFVLSTRRRGGLTISGISRLFTVHRVRGGQAIPDYGECYAG